ncbi:MAG: hypothetical protein U9P12_06040 [Verrucomicrobiota bacterium]|nr:hypothetical protein [Verrucomicrobiota bacterium]
MEDLVPFLIFIVIALVNLVKFVLEKGAKGKTPPAQPSKAPPQRAPSTIERFFEEIAEKLEPEPTPVPDWPEGYERPDYMQEMEDFEEEHTPEIAPIPEPEAAPQPMVHDMPTLQGVEKAAAFQAPALVASSAFAGSSRMRLPSVPMMRSNAAGNIDFDLKSRKNLKRAIIANLIFSQPRAYDRSFDNTLAK